MIIDAIEPYPRVVESNIPLGIKILIGCLILAVVAFITIKLINRKKGK